MPISRREARINARESSTRSTWKSNQRLHRQLQRTPTEPYETLGQEHTEWCSHQVNIVKHPEHDCRAYENEKRAERGAPPL